MKQVYVNNYINSDIMQHEYDIKQNDNKNILSYSNTLQWCMDIRENKCAELTNTGDDFRIKIDTMQEPIVLDYAQAQKLLLLLLVNNDSPIEVKEVQFKTIISI
jgi:hypothetical protein